MSIKRRVDKLEQAQGAPGGDPGDPPPIILTLGSGAKSPETRAAWEWYEKHGSPVGGFRLQCPDGREVNAPR